MNALSIGNVLVERRSPQQCCWGYDEIGPCETCSGTGYVTYCGECNCRILGEHEQCFEVSRVDDDGQRTAHGFVCTDVECVGACVATMLETYPSTGSLEEAS